MTLVVYDVISYGQINCTAIFGGETNSKNPHPSKLIIISHSSPKAAHALHAVLPYQRQRRHVINVEVQAPYRGLFLPVSAPPDRSEAVKAEVSLDGARMSVGPTGDAVAQLVERRPRDLMDSTTRGSNPARPEHKTNL